MKKLFILLLFFSFNSFGQSQIQKICDDYNSKAPIKIDNETTLIGVNCSGPFFSYTYRLDEGVLERYNKVTLKNSMSNNLEKFVNSNAEHILIRNSKRNLGFTYNDMEGNILFVIMYTVSKTSNMYERNKSLEKRILELY